MTDDLQRGSEGTLRAFCVRCGRERNSDPMIVDGDLAACLCGERITYLTREPTDAESADHCQGLGAP